MKNQPTSTFPPHSFQNKRVSDCCSALPLTSMKMALLEKHHFVCLNAGEENFPNQTMGEVQTSQTLPFFRAASSMRGGSLLALCPQYSFACGVFDCRSLAWANWLTPWSCWWCSGISTLPGRWTNVLEDVTHNMAWLTRQFCVKIWF